MIVLSGGTGTPKLIRGLRKYVPDKEITVIVNTAEDIWVSGNLVSPDIDTILYLFAGMLDETKWWGVKNDTYHTYNALKRLGIDEKLTIGDKDRAVHIFRSKLMRKGESLTQAMLKLSLQMKIQARILPMCNEKVDTIINTPKGLLHFQDFWVREGGKLEVLDVEIEGIKDAKPTNEVLDALDAEDEVLIGPSNPITSIMPILSLKGMRKVLMDKKVIAVSPIIGNAPVSGPAGKFMRALGYEVSSKGVAECYGDILDIMVVDEKDVVENLPLRVFRCDTMMTSLEKSEALAKYILELFRRVI